MNSASASDKPKWRLVCRMGDLLPDTGVGAMHNGQAIAVFRLSDNRVYAIGNLDPFSGAAVLARGMVGDIDGVPVVASPIFKQHFRLDNGVCMEDETVSVPSFRALVVDDGIIVETPEK